MAKTPEERVRDATRQGRAAIFTAGEAIPASLVVELACKPEGDEPVHPKGVQIFGATIIGRLDFEDRTLTRPLWLSKCTIAGSINLERARAVVLGFQDCPDIGGIEAGSLRTDGSLFLRRSTVNGRVFLLGADIGNNLECNGAHLDGGTGPALAGDGLKVGGDLFLADGFTAKGTIRLLGAEIGGDLSMTGAHLDGVNGPALGGDRLKVSGALFLRDDFTANGTIRLHGAEIGGNLVCTGAQFNGGSGPALAGDGLKVGGDLFLSDGFSASGTIRLVGADIDGNLSLIGARLDGGDGPALNADGLTVAGALFLRKGFRAKGVLVLAHAHVGTLVDDPDCWPTQPGGLSLNGFTYGAIFASCPLDARSRLDWLHLQPKRNFFDPQPYEQLAKVMKAQGHNSDARKVLIAKERDRQDYLKDFAWAWNHVLEAVIGYGYQPWRAAIWAWIFVWIGWGLFGNAADLGHMVPSKERVYLDKLYIDKGTIPPEYPHLDPLVYSLDLFLPFVDLQQEDYWMPTDQRGQARFLGRIAIVWRWVHIALGWALSALFVAGITGLIKKE